MSLHFLAILSGNPFKKENKKSELNTIKKKKSKGKLAISPLFKKTTATEIIKPNIKSKRKLDTERLIACQGSMERCADSIAFLIFFSSFSDGFNFIMFPRLLAHLS